MHIVNEVQEYMKIDSDTGELNLFIIENGSLKQEE